jgi:CheY-like chemotaxis protein
MTKGKRRRRVLIVEDEPALRLSYERAFNPRYDLVFASTGAEALEQLEQHKPDVPSWICGCRTPMGSTSCDASG